jgi:hypothetical protein
MNSQKIGAALAMALVVCCLAGCGVEEGPEVAGHVTLDGQPLPGAEVQFLPADKDPTKPGAMVTTDEQGNFVIVPDEDTGATLPPGEYAVVISKQVTREGGNVPPEMKEDLEQMVAAGMVRETLPARYSRESATTLKAEIKPEPNQLEFELKSK